jgi:hypothetical protein
MAAKERPVELADLDGSRPKRPLGYVTSNDSN